MFEFLVHCIVFIQRFIHYSIAWEFAENGKTTPLIDWNWIWHLGKHWRNHLSAQFWMFVVDKIVFFLNYGLQHGTLFQVHKLCHISCFFTCYVLSIGNWQCIKIDTFSKYGQHYGPGSTCTSGWQQQQGRGVRHRQAAVSESDCQLRPASRRGNTHIASHTAREGTLGQN